MKYAKWVPYDALLLGLAAYYLITAVRDRNAATLLLIAGVAVIAVLRRLLKNRRRGQYLPGALIGLVMAYATVVFLYRMIKTLFSPDPSTGLELSYLLAAVAAGIWAGLTGVAMVKLIRAARTPTPPPPGM